MSKAVEFIYQDTKIHFLMGGNENVMINATEMAKVFGKRIDHFLRSDHAKAFISVLEFTPYGGNSSGLKREELVQSKGHMGTYMHQILALKFAAWLDPSFEVWVYSTIQDLLFGHYKELDQKLKERAARKKRIEQLQAKLSDNTDFLQLRALELEERQAAYGVSKKLKGQLDIFMQDNESPE